MKLSLFLIFIFFIFNPVLAQPKVEDLKQKIIDLEKRISRLEKIISSGENQTKIKTYSEVWKNIDIWRELRMGMSPNEVKNILGEPTKIDMVIMESFQNETWLYSSSLYFARVVFDYNSQKLVRWKTP